MLKQPGLSETTWADRLGLSEPHPAHERWGEWARRVRVDLPVLREYARVVYAATDAYLDTLSPADLETFFDSPPAGVAWSVAYVLGPLVAGHAYLHAGEISAVKGLQGLKGYSF